MMNLQSASPSTDSNLSLWQRTVECIKQFICYLLILFQITALIGVLPAKAADPVSTNFVCGQDLNNNGYLGDEGEYQACQTATINHTTDASPYCLQGYTMQANGLCMKYEYAPLGSQCPSGYFIQNGRCMQEQYLQAQAYCPSGYIVVGNGCQRVTYTNPTQSCPSGSVIQNGRCISQSQVTPSQSCLAGTTPTTYGGAPACGWVWNNGFPNPTLGTGIPIIACTPVGQIPGMASCFIRPSYICNQGALQGNVCIVSKDNGAVTLVCPSGSQLVNGQCKKTESANLNYLCPTGTLTGNQCKVVTDGGPVQAVCNPGYVVQNGQCVKSTQSAIQYSCTQGTLSGTKCNWNTTENYCPIGVSQSCLNNNGGASCSPNSCIDITKNTPVDDGNIDGTMLVDDGEKSSDGACLDQMFIFNGRGSDCKLAGVSTAFKNCCKSEGKVYTDSVGSSMTVIQAAGYVKNIYGAAKEAYFVYDVAMTATADVAIASEMAAGAFTDALMASFNPATIAIGIAIHFIMEYLMKACDQMSMETAMEADSGMCHEVGTYCKKRIPLLGCVQKAKSYCCFNSKLARIIQEQGRPQLKTFDGWGKPESPQCRGFTPEEFQALDFSKIDMSEYVEDLVAQVTTEIQDNVTQITQDFYEKTH